MPHVHLFERGCGRGPARVARLGLGLPFSSGYRLVYTHFPDYNAPYVAIRTVVRAALVCVLTGVAAWRCWPGTSLGGRRQSAAVAELRQRMETAGSPRSPSRRRFAAARADAVRRRKARLRARRPAIDRGRSSVQPQTPRERQSPAARRVAPQASTSSKEVLKHLPPEMLQRNVWVGGKVVELPFSCPAASCCPIDSKWVSSGRSSSSSPSLGSTPSVVHS